jgi:hypothetical protein
VGIGGDTDPRRFEFTYETKLDIGSGHFVSEQLLPTSSLLSM